MKRFIESQLLEWKQSRRRKPLILLGARQVGKTYILTQFGKNEFEQLVYLNFEEDKSVHFNFEESLDPERIIKNLEAYLNIKITKDTLLFFDEIQLSERALNSLKYFCDKAPQYFVCAAGSLLGVKGKKNHSFPVGKVNSLTLYPMSFLEFVLGIGETSFFEVLRELPRKVESFSEALHKKGIELLKQYYIVGGMPEAVQTYVDTKDFQLVRKVQNELLKNYELDFSKHASATDAPKISAIWRSLPAQLARENKKFKYQDVASSARAREYENALTWLVDANLVLKIERVSTAKLPLSGYVDGGVFKLMLLDVGLLGAMARLDVSIFVSGHRLFTEFNGSFAENYVAQEMTTLFETTRHYYWASEGIAEVDFLIQIRNDIFPVEVKAGENVRSRSLMSYVNQYNPERAFKLSLNRTKEQDKVTMVALYAVHLLKG